MSDPKNFLAKLESEADPAAAIASPATRQKLTRVIVHDATQSSSDGGYRVGRIDASNWEHTPTGIGENSAITAGGDLANRRQRDNYRQIALSRRTVHCLRDLIVGMGLQCLNDPIHFSLSELLEMRKQNRFDDILSLIDYGLASDEAFERWATDPELCDREGRRSWFEMQRTAISEEIQVGDCLIAHEIVDRGPGESPLRLQMYENEQIDKTKDRHESKGSKFKVVNGFVLDDLNREIGVYLYHEHPQESYTYSQNGYRSRFVPASRYQHVFQPTRPSQFSGFSWTHTHGQPLRDRDNFIGTEIRSAVKGAMQIIAAHLKNPEETNFSFEVDDTAAVPRTTPKLSNSPTAWKLDADSGEKVEIIESNRPNPNANDFYDILDHDLAMGVDLSYPTLTGRYNGHTYEGIRGALQAEAFQMAPLQRAFGLQLCLKVRRLHQDLAVANRQIPGVTLAQYNRNKSKLRKFDVVGPERVLLNLEKETGGKAALLRGCLSTFKEEEMRLGKHWLKTLRQICIENELFKLLGIAPDWSKGQGGQITTNARAEDAAKQTEPAE